MTNSGTRVVATLSSGDLIPRTALGPSPVSTPFQTIATVDADRAARLSSYSTASVDRPTDKTQTINTAIALPVAPGIRVGIGLDADLSRSSPDLIPTFGIARRF